VTGAAGLIGGEVCARLVAAGHDVTALVHRNPEVRSNSGAAVAVAQTVACDIRREKLGLEREVYDRLAHDHDLVIHCAATIRFDLTDEEYAAANTQGVAHVLALAQAGGAGLLQVSTAYVCGNRDGPIAEDDPLPHPGGFANGYEASKAAAERLVRAAEIDWAIARPGIPRPDHQSGRRIANVVKVTARPPRGFHQARLVLQAAMQAGGKVQPRLHRRDRILDDVVTERAARIHDAEHHGARTIRRRLGEGHPRKAERQGAVVAAKFGHASFGSENRQAACGLDGVGIGRIAEIEKIGCRDHRSPHFQRMGDSTSMRPVHPDGVSHRGHSVGLYRVDHLGEESEEIGPGARRGSGLEIDGIDVEGESGLERAAG